jgi:hypothetical protein
VHTEFFAGFHEPVNGRIADPTFEVFTRCRGDDVGSPIKKFLSEDRVERLYDRARKVYGDMLFGIESCSKQYLSY